MELKVCDVCLKNKTPLRCDICSNASCKHCCIFIDETVFDYYSLLPGHIKDRTFCPNCYDEKIAKELSNYQDILMKAKNVNVFGSSQGSETRLMKRVEKPIKITDCDSREETLMRLAFIAAEKGYDTLVDVKINFTKTGQNSYVKKVWSGTGTPIDSKKRK